MSDSSIMSVRDMIDTAFGDVEGNAVNHKLIQAVLFILAGHLRVLERRVKVELGPYLVQSESSLSVTEVKIRAMQKKKRKSVKPNDGEREDEGKGKSKRGISGSGAAGGKGGAGSVGGAEGTGRAGFEGKGAGSRKGTQAVGYYFQENRGIGRPGGRGGRGSGAARGRTGGLGGTRGTESGRKETEEGGQEGSVREITTMRVATIEGPRGRSSLWEKDDGTRQGASGGASGKSYKSDKTASEKSTDRSMVDETASNKSTRSYKTTVTKTPLQPTSSSEKPKSTSTEKSTPNYDSGRGGRPEMTLMEEVEIQREKLLRIIHKRADSWEEQNKSPTPMASLDSVDAVYEKLLVVERIPSKEAKKRAALAAKGHTGTITSARVSIVTQEQFASLVNAVKELKQKFEPIGKPEFPENIQLMQELRRGASLTDAMAALQLSARLEATEKALQRMTILLTDLASTTPGVHLELLDADGLEVLYGAPDIASQRSKFGPDSSRKAAIKQQPDFKSKKSTTPKNSSEESFDIKSSEPRSTYSGVTKMTGTQSAIENEDESADKEKDYVTYEELDQSLQKIYNEIMSTLSGITTKSTVTADEVLKAVNKLEAKISSSLELGNRMANLELVTAQYAETINSLDTGLTSQMTNYQEELTQMQHDLETGLETMAEVLANTGGDIVAIAELNSHFSSLQGDIDHTMFIQRELKDSQKGLAIDLEGLRKQIEILREIKADRDEVADALRDKANLGELNGIVSLEQFDAVRGDFEKRIGAAYDKFNNQEAYWQKAIDDVLRELNEKADYIQVVALRDDINGHLQDIKSKLKFISDIVGEPKAALVTRRLHRDANCLSCATPAHMELEERNKVPALPGLRPPAIGAEALKQKDDEGKSYPSCYPGLPIPHPIDPRAHFCRRWCGGSHTTIPAAAANKTPVEVHVDQLRKATTTLGNDGKIYMTEDRQKPCIPCNVPSSSPQPLHGGHVPNQGDTTSSSASTPLDFIPQSKSALPDGSACGVVTTPPNYTSEDL